MPLGTRYIGTGHIADGLRWSAVAPSGGITDTADDVLAAALTDREAHCVALQIYNSDLTVATEVEVKDGSTVIWRILVPAGRTAGALTAPMSFTFPMPLRTTAGNALNVAAVTTAAEVYVNAQGYYA